MTIQPQFIADGQAYSSAHYSLNIKDTKGKTLYEQGYASEDACDQAFNELKISAEPYPFRQKTFYPVELTAQAIVLPNTISMVSDIDNRIAQVVLGALFAVVDIISLPLRLITLIPYTYCWKQETEHKIQALIRSKPEDNKVVLTKSAEIFNKIIPGTIDGKRHYIVQGGKISKAWKEVYLSPSLASDYPYKSGSGSSTINGMHDEKIKELYRAFN